ncbi:DUF4158 domain-containing protein [Streptomyces sp. WAC00276]|uniref:DUF4158 domain-containing protein n=1 Tax=Streptomyces sp. WAC00276 TaxID=2933778 RepID=UPI0035A91F55
MRQEWSPEELLANWTLVDGDWELVGNKSGATRLGFSLLLKFFELEGRFPDVLEEVPAAASAASARRRAPASRAGCRPGGRGGCCRCS